MKIGERQNLCLGDLILGLKYTTKKQNIRTNIMLSKSKGQNTNKLHTCNTSSLTNKHGFEVRIMY